MKQVVQNYRTGELTVEEVPPPVVQPGYLLVENRFSLISAGTEKATVSLARRNLAGKARARPDLVRKVVRQARREGVVETARMVMGRLDSRAALGYSSAGVVLEVGEDVSGFRVGDRVACAGQNYASHGERILVPKNLCLPVPENVTLEDASYVALGAIALQGIRQADPRLGEVVAVVGLGLLGQLAVQMLRSNGCRVVATDIDPFKVSLAESLGVERAVGAEQFERVCMQLSEGQGVDSVILTASTASDGPVRTAGRVCRRKGRVVVVGAVGMKVPRDEYYAKELELRLSMSYGPGRYDPGYEERGQDYPYGYVRWTEKRNMQAFLDLVDRGGVSLGPLTSHRFDIGEADKAYDLIEQNSEPFLGVCLRYPQGDPLRHRENRQRVRAAPQRAAAVRIGLIGVGNHVRDRLLPVLRRESRVSIHAVCTRSGINARAVAEKEGAELCFTDYRELLDEQLVNAVLIGTRHASHAEIVLAALEAGKHVFVEKPLCLSDAQLDSITRCYEEVSRREPRVLQIGFNRRYSEHTMRLREFFRVRANPLMMLYRVNAGEIDRDHWIQVPGEGGGRLVGEACHFVDFMREISGSDPVGVSACSTARHTSGVTSDKSVMQIAYADGSLGTLFYAADGDTAFGKERFEAFADGRSAVMEDFLLSEFYTGGRKRKFSTTARDRGFTQQMEAFIARILEGEHDPGGFFRDRLTTEVTLKAARCLSGEPEQSL